MSNERGANLCPKEKPNKRYTPEFKIRVVETCKRDISAAEQVLTTEERLQKISDYTVWGITVLGINAKLDMNKGDVPAALDEPDEKPADPGESRNDREEK